MAGRVRLGGVTHILLDRDDLIENNKAFGEQWSLEASGVVSREGMGSWPRRVGGLGSPALIASMGSRLSPSSRSKRKDQQNAEGQHQRPLGAGGLVSEGSWTFREHAGGNELRLRFGQRREVEGDPTLHRRARLLRDRSFPAEQESKSPWQWATGVRVAGQRVKRPGFGRWSKGHLGRVTPRG